jgi:hypothetical protein
VLTDEGGRRHNSGEIPCEPESSGHQQRIGDGRVSGELTTSEEEERGGGEEGSVTMAVLIRRAEVGDGRQGGKGRGRGRGVPVNWQTALGRERPETDGRVRRAAAMPRDRLNMGWGRGLTDGP